MFYINFINYFILAYIFFWAWFIYIVISLLVFSQLSHYTFLHIIILWTKYFNLLSFIHLFLSHLISSLVFLIFYLLIIFNFIIMLQMPPEFESLMHSGNTVNSIRIPSHWNHSLYVFSHILIIPSLFHLRSSSFFSIFIQNWYMLVLQDIFPIWLDTVRRLGLPCWKCYYLKMTLVLIAHMSPVYKHKHQARQIICPRAWMTYYTRIIENKMFIIISVSIGLYIRIIRTLVYDIEYHLIDIGTVDSWIDYKVCLTVSWSWWCDEITVPVQKPHQ